MEAYLSTFFYTTVLQATAASCVQSSIVGVVSRSPARGAALSAVISRRSTGSSAAQPERRAAGIEQAELQVPLEARFDLECDAR